MKTFLRRLLPGIAFLLFAATPLTTVSAPPHTGIAGQAWKTFGTPATPVFAGYIDGFPVWIISLQYVPPPEQVATSFTVLAVQKNHSRVVTRVTTDASGNFRVPLPPGEYLLAADPLAGRSPEPLEVTVKARELTQVSISYDFFSGILGTIPINPLPPFSWPPLFVLPPLPQP